MYNHKDGVKFRKLNSGDLSSLLTLKEESWWGTHSTLIVNIDDQKRWYDNIPSNELYLIGEMKNERIGNQYESMGICCFTGIDWIGRSLNISGSVFKNHRKIDIVKAGFAAGLDFAFEMLNMQRVGGEVLETHHAAQQLEIGYLGMKIEGRRRRAVYKSGRYYDSILIGILREEWEETDRVKKYDGCCNQNFNLKLADKSIERLNLKTKAV